MLLPVNFTTFQYPTLLSPGDANAPSNAGTGAPDGNPDLYAINRAGKVIEYPGATATNGIPQFSTPVPIGYTSAPPVVPDAPGDLNGDGTPDLVATDTNGHLRFYADSGNGKPAGAGIDLGGGWAGAIVSHRGDWNEDGYEDLIVHLPNDPVDLWLYPGNGTGGFGTRQIIERPPGPGTIVYATWDVPHIISAGDITGDGRPDLLVVEDDQLLLFPGLGNGQVGSPTVIGTAGWSRMDIMAPGDVNGDGLNDLWARNTSNGDIVQYLDDPTSPTPGASLGLGSRAVTIATGFTTTGVKSAAASGDANGDGQPDLWATWTSDDHLYYYTGTGKNSPGFSGHTDVSGAGWTTTINDIN